MTQSVAWKDLHCPQSPIRGLVPSPRSGCRQCQGAGSAWVTMRCGTGKLLFLCLPWLERGTKASSFVYFCCTPFACTTLLYVGFRSTVLFCLGIRWVQGVVLSRMRAFPGCKGMCPLLCKLCRSPLDNLPACYMLNTVHLKRRSTVTSRHSMI